MVLPVVRPVVPFDPSSGHPAVGRIAMQGVHHHKLSKTGICSLVVQQVMYATVQGGSLGVRE